MSGIFSSCVLILWLLREYIFQYIFNLFGYFRFKNWNFTFIRAVVVILNSHIYHCDIKFHYWALLTPISVKISVEGLNFFPYVFYVGGKKFVKLHFFLSLVHCVEEKKFFAYLRRKDQLHNRRSRHNLRQDPLRRHVLLDVPTKFRVQFLALFWDRMFWHCLHCCFCIFVWYLVDWDDLKKRRMGNNYRLGSDLYKLKKN